MEPGVQADRLGAARDLRLVDPPQAGIIGAPAENHDAADVSRHGDLVGPAVGKQAAQRRQGPHRRAIVDGRHAALVDEDAAGRQTALAVGEERVREQHLAGPDGVGGVDDDDVVERPVALHERAAVGKHQLDARIVKGAGRELRQMLGAQIDHRAVQFHHRHPVHRVAETASKRTAVAAADDQHALCPAMGQQRNVRDHLMVDELVSGGGLHHPIQAEHAAVHRVVEDHHVLVVGLLAEQDPRHLQRLANALVERLAVPLRHGGSAVSPRSNSSTWTSVGRKARRSTGTAL